MTPRYLNSLTSLLVCGLAACAGPEGPTGPAGTPGSDGSQGPAGSAGQTGIAGAAGPAGAVGPRGETGLQGATGATGADGAQGESGARGVSGEKGDTGDTGAVGPAGTPGEGAINLQPEGVAGVVTDTAGVPVTGALVFLIPNTAIEATPPALADFGADSEDDEPFEDLIRADLMAPTFLRAETDASGRYQFESLPAEPFFEVVWPAADDAGHLPGGTGCRTPLVPAAVVGHRRDVQISQSIPSGAYAVGSAVCTNCHGRIHQSGSLMANGLRHLSGNTGRQRLDERHFPGLADLRSQFADGARVFFYDFDANRDADKYEAKGADPGVGHTAAVRADLRQDNDHYYVALTNLRDANDPNNGHEYEVEFSSGGGLTAVQLITHLGASRQVLPVVFQLHGDDAQSMRGTHVWRDYHLDHWYDDATQTLRTPGAEDSFDRNCAGCHFNGYKLAGDAQTGYQAQAVGTDDGLLDYNGDGLTDEMNIGCETCHGPGSKHWESAGQGKNIVSPSLLTPERANLVCGRCHSRPEGVTGTEVPSDANGNFPLPGISRPEFLSNFTTIPDAIPGTDAYNDMRAHSKHNHQQATDFMRSGHGRNQRYLMICTDCHDPHGNADAAPVLLRATISDDALCNSCHHFDPAARTAHILEKSGFNHELNTPTCVNCHMPMTARNGAGAAGVLYNGDQYWMGDVASHLFAVPRVAELVAMGGPVADAVPIPYVNGCGICHQHFAPNAAPVGP